MFSSVSAVKTEENREFAPRCPSRKPTKDSRLADGRYPLDESTVPRMFSINLVPT
ncbi:hypothetical protein AN958_06450 [Leucoagaricus sp. SymC.cos]|nr:hypothetical protein AN958_06450 [Leucoagaricus sp. SymC.cos]